jgi:hypothetical protein
VQREKDRIKCQEHRDENHSLFLHDGLHYIKHQPLSINIHPTTVTTISSLRLGFQFEKLRLMQTLKLPIIIPIPTYLLAAIQQLQH